MRSIRITLEVPAQVMFIRTTFNSDRLMKRALSYVKYKCARF